MVVEGMLKQVDSRRQFVDLLNLHCLLSEWTPSGSRGNS